MKGAFSEMIRMRFHGRGGQGAVLACEVLAAALLRDGKYAQSMPLFGGERRGAPVTAFLRVDDTKILERGIIEEPDHLIVLDPALVRIAPVTRGLREEGLIAFNSAKEPDSFDSLKKFQVVTVDANSIARKHGLGSAMAPVVNTCMLGAFAKLTGLVSLDSLLETIRERAPVRKEENAAAAKEAYDCIGKIGGYK